MIQIIYVCYIRYIISLYIIQKLITKVKRTIQIFQTITNKKTDHF